MNSARIVLIDNIDSFSYNLVDELRQLDFELVVYRNQVPAESIIKALKGYQGQQVICLSPGPGHPDDAGNMMEIIEFAKDRYPLLGICLGFQALVTFAGGRIDRCGEVVHGKTATMDTCSHPVFDGINDNQQCVVARYHSLSAYDLPENVKVIGWVNDIPMAAEFSNCKALGFQFHPESLLTPNGKQMLANSVDYLLSQTDRFTGTHHEPS
ncbi:aminodeoxychorismate/anthranilate synthase component II [Idiomarina seosinensis]|uniref:aminodeoxychorismate/anthranilate synthase component II n=1 Tax=Idiomarina seosinensis TaxID=281739 RepID=UPI003850DE5D